VNTLNALITNAGRAALLCVAFGLAMYLLERVFGADTRQYRSRNFAHDVFYWVVNGSGLFQIAGGVLVLTTLLRAFPQAQLHPLDGLPQWLRYSAHLVAFDFLSYWVHRLQHANPVLWSFHATHHTQEELSFATTARSHPVEQWFIGLVVFLSIVLLFGAPSLVWLPVVLV